MPRTGGGFAGIFVYRTDIADMREYIQVELIEPLQADKCYLVEFYVNTPNDHALISDGIGALLSTGEVTANNAQPLSGNPQINNTNSQLLSDTVGWTRIFGYITADGGEDHITIGNFKYDDQTQTEVFNPSVWYTMSSYLYVDDVRVEEIPFEVSLAADTTICTNESLTLDASTQADNYIWNTGNTDSVQSVETSGIYSVIARLGGCMSRDTTVVQVDPLPEVEIIGEDSFCEDESIVLIAKSQNGGEPIWSNGLVGDTIIANESGEYSVLVENHCGAGSASKTVESVTCFCEVYVPDAFTPNDDGVNEGFRLESECEFKSFSLTIHNRWGQEVFASGDVQLKWDGTYKGKPVESGTYTWVFLYEAMKNGSLVTRLNQGVIRLLR